MGNFFNPITPHDPFGENKIKVTPIERDKKDSKQPPPFEKPKDNRSSGAILYILKKIFTLFQSSKSEIFHLELEHILENLDHFKKCLMRLQKENLSQDTAFLKEFSETWNLLNGKWKLPSYLIEKDPTLKVQIVKFMRSFENYPPDEEHSLGFYLKESVGKDWFPFPCMNLLNTLHREEQESPDASQLKKWVATIDKLLTQLSQ